MARLRGKDLQSIYPKQKTYDETQADKAKQAARRRPKHAKLKVSFWTTAALSIAIAIYALISKIMSISLDSGGEVIFGVSISVLLLVIALGVMYYLWLLTSNVVQKLLVNPAVLYVILIIIIGIILLLFDMMAKGELLNPFTVIGLVCLNAVSVYTVAHVMIKN